MLCWDIRHAPVWSTASERRTVPRMTGEAAATIGVALAKLGQLTPVQVYRAGKGLELFDGFKRVRAARQLSWSAIRAEVHVLDAACAKVRLLAAPPRRRCPISRRRGWCGRCTGTTRSPKPQIAVLLGRHKSWVCRRLTLSEGLSDGITASVRLGLLSATAARELARLPRGNQDAVAQAVARRGMTTRQTARLVDALLAATAALCAFHAFPY